MAFGMPVSSSRLRKGQSRAPFPALRRDHTTGGAHELPVRKFSSSAAYEFPGLQFRTAVRPWDAAATSARCRGNRRPDVSSRSMASSGDGMVWLGNAAQQRSFAAACAGNLPESIAAVDFQFFTTRGTGDTEDCVICNL